MKVKSNVNGGILFIKMCGELDQHNADIIRSSLEAIISDNQFTKAVFDLGELEFMDSSGIGILIGRYKKFLNLQVPVYISEPKKHIDRMLTMSGIYKLMPKIEIDKKRKGCAN